MNIQHLHGTMNQIKADTDCMITFIFDNEEDFLEEFCKFNAIDLTELGFSSHYLRYTYIEYDGAHIVDCIGLEEFTGWCEKIINKGED